MTEKTEPNRVEPGHHIRLELHYRSGQREELEFDLVPDELAGLIKGAIGLSTPLAQSILNEKTGIIIPYFTDEIMGLKILEINFGNINLDQRSSTQRQGSLDEIKAQISFREAQLFAASGNTKWGSYDPDGMDYEEWKKSGISTTENEEFNHSDQT